MGLWKEAKKKSQKSATAAYKKKTKDDAKRKKASDSIKKKKEKKTVEREEKQERISRNAPSKSGTASHRTGSPEKKTGSTWGSYAKRASGAEKAREELNNTTLGKNVSAATKQRAETRRKIQSGKKIDATGGWMRKDTIKYDLGAAERKEKAKDTKVKSGRANVSNLRSEGRETAKRPTPKTKPDETFRGGISTRESLRQSKIKTQAAKKYESDKKHEAEDKKTTEAFRAAGAEIPEGKLVRKIPAKKVPESDQYVLVDEVKDKKTSVEKALKEDRAKTSAIKFAKKEEEKAKQGKHKSESMTQEEYQSMINAIRTGNSDLANKMLGDKLAEKVGSRTAYSAGKAKITAGVLQGLSPVDTIQNTVGTYNKSAKNVLKETKESGAYEGGYMAGFMGQFLTSGAGAIGQGIGKTVVKGGGKVLGKNIADETFERAGRRFVTNRVGEMVAETPINIGDAIKMSTDENGKVDRKELAKYLALNSVMTIGGGGLMEGAGVGLAKKDVRLFEELRGKQNAGTITQEEASKLRSLNDKIKRTAANENSASGPIARNEMPNVQADRVYRKLKKKGLSEDKIQKAMSRQDLQEYFNLRAKGETGPLSKQEARQLAKKEEQYQQNVRDYTKELDDEIKGLNKKIQSKENLSLSDAVKAIDAVSFANRTGNKAMAKEATKAFETIRKNVQNDLDAMGKKSGTDYVVATPQEINKALADANYKAEFGDLDNGIVIPGKDGKKRIYVNMNSEDAYRVVIGHETTHLLSKTKSFGALKDAIKTLGEENGDYKKLFSSYSELYADEIKGMSKEKAQEYIEEEVTAQLVGKYLFGDASDDFIKTLSKDKSAFRQVYDIIVEALNKILKSGEKAETAEADALMKAKEKFEQAFKEMDDTPNSVEIDGVKYAKNSNGENAVTIRANMKDSERAKVLSESAIDPAVPNKSRIANSTKEFDNLVKASRGKAEETLYAIGKKFGIFEKEYYNKSIDLNFMYSRNGVHKSSIKQLAASGEFRDLAKVMACFEDVVDRAVPVEVHTDRYIGTYRENDNLLNTYALISAIRDEDSVLPVELIVKEHKGKQRNTLYVTVVLEDNKKKTIMAPGLNRVGGDTDTMPSAITIQELIEKINPKDSDFLKYFPDALLSKDQLSGKAVGIKAENDNITLLRRETLERITRLENEIEALERDGKPTKNLTSTLNRYKRLVDSNRSEYEADGLLPPISGKEAMEIPPLGEVKKSKGYHAGDLGKSESMGNQSGGRGTGHFGTGTYFVGDKAKIEGYNSRNGVPAPVEEVEFSNYNLFKPSNTQDAYKLHDFLKGVNNYFEFVDKPVTKLGYAGSVERRVDDLDYKLYDAETPGEKTRISQEVYDLGKEALGDDVDRLVGDVPREKLTEDDVGRLIYELQNGDNFGGWKSGIESIRDFYGVDLPVMALRLNTTEDKLLNAIRRAKEQSDKLGDSKARYQADSASTILMKELGYEGIDVRGTDLDNTMYGSVIYDLKGEDLARKEEIGTARFSKSTKGEAKDDLKSIEGMSDDQLKSEIKGTQAHLKNAEKAYGEEAPRVEQLKGHLDEAKTEAVSRGIEEPPGLKNVDNDIDIPKALKKPSEEEIEARKPIFKKEERATYDGFVGKRDNGEITPVAKEEAQQKFLDRAKEEKTKIQNAKTKFMEAMVDNFYAFEKIGRGIKDAKKREQFLAQINELRVAKRQGRSIVEEEVDPMYKKYGLDGKKNAAKRQAFEDYCFLMHNRDRIMHDTDIYGKFVDRNAMSIAMKKLEDGKVALRKAEEDMANAAVFTKEMRQARKNAQKMISNAEKEIEQIKRDGVAKVDEVLEDMRGKYGTEIENFQQDVVKFFDALNKRDYESGLIGRNGRDGYIKLKKEYPNYVPTFREKDFDKLLETETFDEIDIKKGMKATKGGEDPLVPLYNQMISKTNRVMKRTEENRMMQMVADVIGGGVKAEEIPAEATPIDVLEAVPHVWRDKGQAKVLYYVDGVSHEVEISDDLFREMSRWTGDEKLTIMGFQLGTDPISRTTSKGARLFKSAITDYNVLFGIKNAIRDQQTALLFTKDRVGYIKAFPKVCAALTPDWMIKRMPKRMQAYYQKYRDVYKVYMKSGGKYSPLVNSTEKAFEETMKKWNKLNPFQWASEFNAVLETFPRMQEFTAAIDSDVKKLVKSGMSEESAYKRVLGDHDSVSRAMYRSKDITVNFDRGGTVGRWWNSSFVPFLNPSIQGLDKTYKWIVKDNKTATEWVKMLATLSVGVGGAGYLWEMHFNENEDYKALTNYYKDNYYCLPVGDGKFIKIPKAREIGALQNPLDHLIRQTEFGEPGEWKEMFKIGFEQLGPVSPLTDNLFMPAFNTIKNRNWYGGNIENADDQRMIADGQSDLVYDEKTSLLAIKLGKTDLAKKYGVSPKKIDNLMDSYLGVVYDMIIGQFNQTNQSSDDKYFAERTVKRIMETNFIVDSYISNKYSGYFYDKNDKIFEDLKNAKKGTQKYRDATAAQRRYRNNFYYDNEVYNNAIAEIKESKKLTAEQKAEKVRMLRREQRQLQEDSYNGKETSSVDVFGTLIKEFGLKKTINEFTYTSTNAQEGEYNPIKKAFNKFLESDTYKKKGMAPFKETFDDLRKFNKAVGESSTDVDWDNSAFILAHRARKTGEDVTDLRKSFGVWDSAIERANKYYDNGGSLKEYKKTHKLVVDASTDLGYEYTNQIDDAEAALALAKGKTLDRGYYAEKIDKKTNPARCVVTGHGWTAQRLSTWAAKNGISSKKCDQYNPKYDDNDITPEYVAKCIEKNSGEKTREGKAGLFALYFPDEENPFGEIGDYSLDGDAGIKEGGKGRRGRRRGRRGRGGRGGGGGGGPDDWFKYAEDMLTKTTRKKLSASRGRNFTTKSQLNEAYRRRARAKQMVTKK